MTSPVRSGFRKTVRPSLRALTAGFLLTFAVLGACRLYRLERQLSPAHAEFLDKVGYIITRAERRSFLELADERKEGFIEEFWRRRDPDPDTEHNAFKAEYEERIARAATLFHGEGRPGWQTDRGRIFVLFGPPRERMTYPMDAGGFCREIWYYGAFPVVFIDEHCSGRFVLTAVNLEHLHNLNIAQGYFQKTIQEEAKRLFDYEASVHTIRSEPELFEGVARVDIPYASIWFTFRGERLETAFELKLALKDGAGQEVWEAHSTFPITLQEGELVAQRDKVFRMEVPFVIDKDLDRLRTQTLTLHIAVTNTTEGGELRKVLEFRLEP